MAICPTDGSSCSLPQIPFLVVRPINPTALLTSAHSLALSLSITSSKQAPKISYVRVVLSSSVPPEHAVSVISVAVLNGLESIAHLSARTVRALRTGSHVCSVLGGNSGT